MSANRFSATVVQLRPLLWPFVWIHCLTGFVMASGRDALGLSAEAWLRGLVTGGVWAVLLSGAATGLTSLFRAFPLQEELGSDDTPSHPPEGEVLGWTAVCMLLLGLAISPTITWRFFDVYLVGMVVAVLHATPPVRLGRFRLSSFCIQAAGYGALTLYAGFTAAGANRVQGRLAVLYLSGFAVLFLALRLLFWMESSRLMPLLYATCVLGGFVCLGLAEVQMGSGWRVAALGLPPLAAWVVLGLARFLGRGRQGHVLKPVVALGGWLLTDLAVGLSALLR